MELPKAQKGSIVTILSRWHAILIGLVVGLLMSAIFTSNFATKVVPNPLNSVPSASPSSSSSFSPLDLPNQLFVLLFRGHDYASSQEEKSYDDYQRSLSIPAGVQVQSSASDTRAVLQNRENKIEGGTARSHLSDNCQGNHNRTKHTMVHDPDVDVEKQVASPPIRSSRTDAEDASVEVSPLSGTDVLTSVDAKHAAAETSSHVKKQCAISIGKWVQDESYPLYQPSACPFVDEGFNCQQNGRPDSNYTRWRWAPHGCDIPRLNGSDMLMKLRGKRLVFVGDSLNRNQWESMLCILREALPDKSRIVQILGGRISKLPGAFVFKFLDYDCRVEFYTSHYLVEEEEPTTGDATQFTIRLDRMDKSERRWRKADVLVFNTGHWWTPDKIGEGEDRFWEKGKLYSKLDVDVAYRKFLHTWARWVDRHVNPANTTVFFRGYSPLHYIGGQWNSGGQCHTENEPIFNESYLMPYPDKMQELDEVIQHMKVPVKVLNITRLSDFRKDAHPAVYGHPAEERQAYQDCSHWCLPGLPDTWNELLYYSLFNTDK